MKLEVEPEADAEAEVESSAPRGLARVDRVYIKFNSSKLVKAKEMSLLRRLVGTHSIC
jgi:hypothetical protein